MSGPRWWRSTRRWLAGEKLHAHERDTIRFLLKHLAGGLIGAALLLVAILLFDVGGIGSLVAGSETPVLGVFLMGFGLAVTFGSVAMGIGIMSLGQERDSDP